jgi:Holliday junction resolvasome RuvABC endonuclease subunit
MLILGIDVSTAVTGYTLMDTERPQIDCLIKSDGIHLSKFKRIYDKAEHIRDHFKYLKKSYDIDVIYVEEALQSFRRGLSSAKTLSTLMRFNGIVCFLAEDIFNKEVNLVNVVKARSSLGIKINRKSDVSTKDQVFEWIQSREEFTNFSWPMKTLKTGPRAGKTIFDKSCYDIADAAIMSLYGFKETNI